MKRFKKLLVLVVFIASCSEMSAKYSEIPQIEFVFNESCKVEKYRYKGSNEEYYRYPIFIRFINYPEGVNIGHVYGLLYDEDNEMVRRSIRHFEDEFCYYEYDDEWSRTYIWVAAESETDVITSSEYKLYYMRVPKGAINHLKGCANYKIIPYARAAYGDIDIANRERGIAHFFVYWDGNYYNEEDYDEYNIRPFREFAEKLHYKFSDGYELYFIIYFGLVALYVLLLIIYRPAKEFKFSLWCWALKVILLIAICFFTIVGDCYIGYDVPVLGEELLVILPTDAIIIEFFISLFVDADISISASRKGVSREYIIRKREEQREINKEKRRLKREAKKREAERMKLENENERRNKKKVNIGYSKENRKKQEVSSESEVDAGKVALYILVFVAGAIILYIDANDGIGSRKRSNYEYYDKDYGHNAGSSVSFGAIKHSCNHTNHHCTGGVDLNNDGWCDVCKENGYNCHMVDHLAK